MVLCDVCGVNMTDEKEISVIGLVIKVTQSTPGEVHPELCRIQDTFGKTEFRICFVCWLKSLGLKEKGVM